MNGDTEAQKETEGNIAKQRETNGIIQKARDRKETKRNKVEREFNISLHIAIGVRQKSKISPLVSCFP